MGRKAKVSKELKVKACKDYLSGKRSVIQIANSLSVNKLSVQRWIASYRENGASTFNDKARNSSYSSGFKQEVVNDYLIGLGSYPSLAAKYDISESMVFSWVKMYNSGKELKDYDPKGDVYTMKSRKTTQEEKIEIIKYAIENNYDYKGAADKYLVPYANVFNWVKKYEANPENGLTDNRGRPSLSGERRKELTELEKIQIELEKEKLKNTKLELAIEALKKNEEIRKQLAKRTRK